MMRRYRLRAARLLVAMGFGLPGLVLLGFVPAGCGSPPPAAAPRAAAAEEPPAEPTDLEALPADGNEPDVASGGATDDGLDADIAALSASTRPSEAASAGPPPASASAPAEPAPGEAPGAGREIVYRVTPKGLVIEIDGIHLRPEAKPFRDKSGAYGIELTVNAESFDGRQYWVNKASEGPLSIAGKIEGKAGKSERFGDERTGSGGEVVMDRAPRHFKQRWPGRGQPKAWPGQTVTLEVGLWGVRAESERERPVRRLFVVKMVAGNKSPAVITPPTLDWGT